VRAAGELLASSLLSIPVQRSSILLLVGTQLPSRIAARLYLLSRFPPKHPFIWWRVLPMASSFVRVHLLLSGVTSSMTICSDPSKYATMTTMSVTKSQFHAFKRMSATHIGVNRTR